jgi:hypothetical protein
MTFIQTKLIEIATFLTGTLTDPKKFLILALVVDTVLVGKLGIIGFLFGMLKEALTFGVTGGWSLLVIVLVVALIVKSK